MLEYNNNVHTNSHCTCAEGKAVGLRIFQEARIFVTFLFHLRCPVGYIITVYAVGPEVADTADSRSLLSNSSRQVKFSVLKSVLTLKNNHCILMYCVTYYFYILLYDSVPVVRNINKV